MENQEQSTVDNPTPETEVVEQQPNTDVEQGADDQGEGTATPESEAEAKKKVEEERHKKRQAAIDNRFAKLHYEKKEAERQAQALREKYESQEQSSLKEPQLHDYDSIDEWSKALGEYQVKKAEKEVTSRFEQQRTEQQQMAQQVKLEAAETEFQKTNPDYQRVVGGLVSLSGGQLSQQLSSVILELGDEAPAILYELAKEPEDCIDLLNASPTMQLLKLGEIRASLKNAPKIPKIPNAPAPVTLTQGKANTKKDPYKGSDDEFLRSRGLA